MDMIKDKPKIAIVLDEMSVGGIPVSCISFLKELCLHSKVTMFLCNTQGEFTDQIPTSAKIEAHPFSSLSSVVKELLREKRLFSALSLAFNVGLCGKIGKHWVKSTTRLCKAMGKISDEEFDCVIAYHGMNIRQLTRTLYQFNAKKKIAWIHGDHPFLGKHRKDAERVYQEFDHIFCVSEETKKRFVKDFPSVKEKTRVYYNHLPVSEIVEKANIPIGEVFAKDKTCLLTVGRISPEKGQDMIPRVMKILLNKNLNVHWYIVGDGADRERIEKLVEQENLREYITLLGNKTNPYPYMKSCDVYVQPSYTEGYALTIFETALFEKPIIATDVGGARELLKDGEDILFVQPTADSIANGIERMLLEEGLKEKILNNLRGRDFSNAQEIEKIMNVIEK